MLKPRFKMRGGIWYCNGCGGASIASAWRHWAEPIEIAQMEVFACSLRAQLQALHK